MSATRASRFGLGPWEIDLAVGTAVSAEDVVSLTPTEGRLLEHLRTAEGAPVGREVLLREVWEYASTVRSRTVDTTLRRLRDKLEPDRSAPTLLMTYRGQGIALERVRDARPLPSPTRLVRRPDAPRLVGRQSLIDRVMAALDTSEWITLVGPAGVGKTALALVVADRWDDGERAALVVPVAGCTRGEDVEAEVRRVIDGGRSDEPLDALIGTLQDALLILDDADALPPSEAERLLSLARTARVLVTRHAPLSLAPERQVRVGPLDEPSARELAEALAQRRDTELPTADLSRVVEACGGLPLAIELAVPIATVAGGEALRGADWHGVDTSASGTLAAALERSIAALDDAARSLLTDLTAFSGAFDADAAGALASASSTTGALGPLMRLHERGLVAGRGAMRLLSPVRLHAGPAPRAALDARDTWLADLGRRDLVVTPFASRHQGDLLHALARTDHPGPLAWSLVNAGREAGMGLDIVEALRVALDQAPDDALVRASLVGALYFRGEHGDDVQALAEAIPDALGHWVGALLARDPQTREHHVIEGGTLARRMDAPIGVTGVVRADLLGRDPDARRALSGLRALRAAATDAPHLHARIDASMALVELRLGRIGSARRRLDEGGLQSDPYTRVIHGIIAVVDGDLAAAMEPFERARDRFAEIGDRIGLGGALAFRDVVAWATGAEITGVTGPPLPPGTESLRRFVADPGAVPLDQLPDPDCRRLVGAWRGGDSLPDDLRGWPMRMLRAVLERVPPPT